MTAGAGRSIWWDAENRPLSITMAGITTTFTYDGDGKRVRKAESDGAVTTSTVYIGNHYELVSTSYSTALPWWNPRWAKREVLTITNQLTATLPASYTIRLTLSGPSANCIYTQSLASGNDLRVLYWDGKAYKDLDRDLVSFTASAIELRVRTQAAIPASGQDAGYFLYYANPTAGPPPREGKKVYAYFDDFSINALDWTATSGVWGQAVTSGHDGNLTWTYRQSDATNGSAGAYQKDLNLADLVYEVKMRVDPDLIDTYEELGMIVLGE